MRMHRAAQMVGNHLPLGLTLVLCLSATAADLSGHKFLITSVRTGDTEVFIADPTTGDMFNVTRSPTSEDRYPCWSPDGKRICFMSDREGTTNLWICNADGSQVRRLNRTAAVCYMPSWQRTSEGERIIFGKHGAKPEIANIKPDGTDEQILGDGHDPTLSPDGTRVCYTGAAPEGGVTVYAEKPADKRPVWVIRPDGSEAQVIESLHYQMAMDGSRAAWKP